MNISYHVIKKELSYLIVDHDLEKKFEVFDIESFEKAAKEISSDLNISEEDTEKILMDTMKKSSRNEDGITTFTVRKAEDTEKAQYEIYRNYDDNFIIRDRFGRKHILKSCGPNGCGSESFEKADKEISNN